MVPCKFCGLGCEEGICDSCKQQVLAARNAREVMEQRIADLEGKLTFVMNFFRPSFASPIVGAPAVVMSLLEVYEKRKLESAAQAEQQTAAQSGIING